VNRQNVDVKVSAYDMANTYMPAWEMLVKTGKALGVMCSYNAVNGLPTCGNPALNQTLRGDWGFEGYMTVCTVPSQPPLLRSSVLLLGDGLDSLFTE
jgi:beta-glucosidase-like glycosyl hydrolase